MDTITLNDIMQRKFNEFCESGKIEELFQTQIDKAISEIIKDQFSSSGNIKKAIDEKIKSDLHLDLSGMSLSEHNLKLTQTIKNSLDKYFSNETKQIQERIVKELDYDHKEIKLSEIVDKFREKWCSEKEKDYEDTMTVIIEDNKEIYIGSDCDMTKYSCEVHIRIDISEKREGVWNVCYRDSDLKKDSIFSLSWEPETFLYKLYANKTIIIIDSYDEYYKPEEEY